MMEALSPSKSIVTMTELVLPHHMNALGTAFGGVILSWIDIIGSICAAKHCSHNVVTASIDDVHFYHPVYKGDVVSLKAQMNYTHRTSMEVGVRVKAQSLNKGPSRHTVAAYMTLVALDDHFKPTKVPPLLLKTEEEKKTLSGGTNPKNMATEEKKAVSKVKSMPCPVSSRGRESFS